MFLPNPREAVAWLTTVVCALQLFKTWSEDLIIRCRQNSNSDAARLLPSQGMGRTEVAGPGRRSQSHKPEGKLLPHKGLGGLSYSL